MFGAKNCPFLPQETQFTAFLSQMSRESQHTRFEDQILHQVSLVVPAWSTVSQYHCWSQNSGVCRCPICWEEDLHADCIVGTPWHCGRCQCCRMRAGYVGVTSVALFGSVASAALCSNVTLLNFYFLLGQFQGQVRKPSSWLHPSIKHQVYIRC